MALASRTGHPRTARPGALEEDARSRVPAAQSPSPSGTPGHSEEGQPLQGAHEVNERCLEMLVNAARHPPARPFPLISELRDLLKGADPSVRRRAARRSFLLVDLEFGNPDWWHTARNHPSQQIRTPLWWGCFPRVSAIQLARATLVLAWNNLRADPAAARILLGMAAPVAEVIASLRFDEIDRIAQKRFRNVRPRWDDRPAVWRRLLVAAQTDDERRMAAFNLHGLQLLAGELLPQEENRNRSATRAGRLSGALPQAAEGLGTGPGGDLAKDGSA